MKVYINSAIKALFNSIELSSESVEAQPKEKGGSVAAQTKEEGETKLTLLWSCTFVQELREVLWCPLWVSFPNYIFFSYLQRPSNISHIEIPLCLFANWYVVSRFDDISCYYFCLTFF